MSTGPTEHRVERDTRIGDWLLADEARIEPLVETVVTTSDPTTSVERRRLRLLTRVARAALAEELIGALRAVLGDTMADVLVAGWSTHETVLAAADETRAHPGSESVVSLADHRLSRAESPSIDLVVDGVRLATLTAQLALTVEVAGAVAFVRDGRLMRVRTTAPSVRASLELEGVLLREDRARLDITGELDLGNGVDLVRGRRKVT
jgi:hypothetical protein